MREQAVHLLRIIEQDAGLPEGGGRGDAANVLSEKSRAREIDIKIDRLQQGQFLVIDAFLVACRMVIAEQDCDVLGIFRCLGIAPARK